MGEIRGMVEIMKTPSIPIVFFHKGDAWYLWYTLRQARLTNPEAPIYLLGDVHCRRYDRFAEFVDLRPYDAAAREFAGLYVHLSTNHADFELVCFQRWFVLREFMREKGLDRCVYLDSDVMAYTDLAGEFGRFAEKDLTLTK